MRLAIKVWPYLQCPVCAHYTYLRTEVGTKKKQHSEKHSLCHVLHAKGYTNAIYYSCVRLCSPNRYQAIDVGAHKQILTANFFQHLSQKLQTLSLWPLSRLVCSVFFCRAKSIFIYLETYLSRFCHLVFFHFGRIVGLNFLAKTLA